MQDDINNLKAALFDVRNRLSLVEEELRQSHQAQKRQGITVFEPLKKLCFIVILSLALLGLFVLISHFEAIITVLSVFNII